MATKKMRQLKKIELLELLVASERENEELREQLAVLEEEYNKRELKIKNAGNLADACIQLNKVFESAQATADQYLENVKNLGSDKCGANQYEIHDEAEEALLKAELQAEQLLAETKLRCAEMEEDAQQRVEEKWQTIRGRLEELYDAHLGLRDLVANSKSVL